MRTIRRAPLYRRLWALCRGVLKRLKHARIRRLMYRDPPKAFAAIFGSEVIITAIVAIPEPKVRFAVYRDLINARIAPGGRLRKKR